MVNVLVPIYSFFMRNGREYVKIEYADRPQHTHQRFAVDIDRQEHWEEYAKFKREWMSDDKPNHTQSIDSVFTSFQDGLAAAAKRAEETRRGTDRAFAKVNQVFDQADYVNSYIEGQADSLLKFLGPPPNEINMPKVIEHKGE